MREFMGVQGRAQAAAAEEAAAAASSSSSSSTVRVSKFIDRLLFFVKLWGTFLSSCKLWGTKNEPHNWLWEKVVGDFFWKFSLELWETIWPSCGGRKINQSLNFETPQCDDTQHTNARGSKFSSKQYWIQLLFRTQEFGLSECKGVHKAQHVSNNNPAGGK